MEAHWRHCVVSLSNTLHPLLSTGSTQEDRKISRHDLKIVDFEVKHKKTNNKLLSISDDMCLSLDYPCSALILREV